MFTNARSSRPSRWNSARTSRSIRRRLHENSRFRQLRTEQLEDRRMLAGITYNDFGDATGLQLVNDAAIANGNVLRLTPAAGGMEGAAWYTADKPFVSVDWETTFAFNLNDNSDASGGSDGFVFIIQNHAPTYLSGGGGTLGYYDLPNSLAVEFDTFQNSEANDPSQSHISVHTNGTGENTWDESLSLGAYDTPSIIDDATTHTVKIGYTPGNLSVFLDDLVNPVLTVSVDLAETLDLDFGRAWVGFTATTGGGYQNHDILNWEFSSLADTTPVITIGDAAQLEGDAGQTLFDFPIVVSRPDTSGPLTVQVDYATADGTAVQPSDYTAASGSLTFHFTDGQAEATEIVSVPVQGDLEIEDSETFWVSLSDPVGAVVAVSQGQGTIITDDITISIDDVTVVEGEEKGLFLDVFVPGSDAVGLDRPGEFILGPEDGHIYAASLSSDEILRYDAVTGELIDVFVSRGSGGLDDPWSLAFGPDNNLYVSCWATHQVLRYRGDTGEFMDAFVPAGSGGLNVPAGIVFDADQQFLYVASLESDAVLRYDAATGLYVDSPVTAANSGLDRPVGLTFDTSGNLYVTSSNTHEVIRYDPSTGDVGVFVTAGHGGLDFPSGLVFDSVGNLYVASCPTHQVLRYDSTGTFKGAFVAPASGGLQWPDGVRFDARGNLLVTSAWTNSVLRFDGFTGGFMETLIDGRHRLGAPHDIALRPDGYVYVNNYVGASVQRYDATTGAWIDTFVNPLSGGFDGAVGMAFGPDGNLYMASWNQARVAKFSGADGTFLQEFVSPGSGGLDGARGLTFGPDDNLYVASSRTNSVLRYEGTSGTFMDEFVASGSGGLAHTSGVIFGPDGHLYVSEGLIGGTHRVLRYNGTTGAFMDVFAVDGDPSSGAQNMIFGPDGNLYVSRWGDDRVVRYDGNTGEYIDDFVPTGYGGVISPWGLAFDSNDVLHVVSVGTNQVLRYESRLYAGFTVTLSNPRQTPVTVDYTTTEGTAEAGSDFVFTDGTVTFEPGETSKTIVVYTLDDELVEQNESFTVDLSNANGATIVLPTGVATILEHATYANTVPQALKDANNPTRPGVTTSTLAVDALGEIFDVNVEVDISHTYDGQLTATLIAPDGTRVELFSEVGGDGDNFARTVLDDEADSSIIKEAAPFTGRFRPERRLAALDGKDAAGTWSLEISDDTKGGTGTLNSWSLEIASFEPTPNVLPVADADGPYSGTEDLSVSFDGSGSSDSDGTVEKYTWDFGDGTAPITTTAPTIDYTYQWGGEFDVTLTVEDDQGGTATASSTATITEVNDAPAADPGGPYSGTVNTAIEFDGSGSSDFDNLDGTTANDQTLSYEWDFGDGSDPVTTSEETISYTYAAEGFYTVHLTVYDGVETSGVQTTQVEVTATQSSMHVGDLDGTADSINRTKWAATVTVIVHDADGTAVPNATVQGTWSTGLVSTASTNAGGLATVSSGNVAKSIASVTFTVSGIQHATLTYDPNMNRDPDIPPDSNGMAIVVFQDGSTEPPQSLMAAGGYVSDAQVASLTPDLAETVTNQALALWSQQLVMVPRVNVNVADLPAGTLGWAYGNTITLDVNANGAGWYTDFNAPAAGRFDLLTVVTHEIGHLLGYDHSDVADDPMNATLPAGTRRSPDRGPVEIEWALWGPLSTATLHTWDEGMVPAKHSLAMSLASTTASSDESLSREPLVTARLESIRVSRKVNDIRIRDLALDDETELVEENLLDLLARAVG